MKDVKTYTGIVRNQEDLYSDDNIYLRWCTYEEGESHVEYVLEDIESHIHLSMQFLKAHIDEVWNNYDGDGSSFEITGTLYDEFKSILHDSERFETKWKEILPIVKCKYEDYVREHIDMLDVIYFAYESMLDNLTELIYRMNPYGKWYCEVSGFGWRKLDGYKIFDASNGSEFLRNILPDTDCTFTIYTNEVDIINIRNSHHDGTETYFIVPYDEAIHGEE